MNILWAVILVGKDIPSKHYLTRNFSNRKREIPGQTDITYPPAMAFRQCAAAATASIVMVAVK